MAITLNSNISSLRTMRALGQSSSALQRSFERLSSGLRIVHASDDAAGLAIATKLNVDNRVFNRARLNINDGTSAINIADGAVGEIGSVLARMAELAEQASNGSMSSTQRRRIDEEYQKLSLEVERIGATTSFNNMGLLTGSRSARGYQQVSTDYSAGVGISGDGTYFYYTDNSGRMHNYNRVTGRDTTIAGLDTYYSVGINSVSSDGRLLVASGSDLKLYDPRTNSSRQLTLTDLGMTAAVNSALSADGSTAIVQGSSGATIVFAKIDFDTGAITNLYRGNASIQLVSVSSDGTKLALTSSANLTGQNSGGANQFYYTETNSFVGAMKQVSTNTSNFSFSSALVSNDGKVFVLGDITKDGTITGSASHVWRYDAATQARTALADVNAIEGANHLQLGADGRTLVWIGSAPWGEQTDGTYYTTFRFNTEIGSVTALTDGTQEPSRYGYGGGEIWLSRDGNVAVFDDGTFTGAVMQDQSLASTNNSIEVGQGRLGGISFDLAALNGTLRGLGAYALTSSSGAMGALDLVKRNIQALAQLRASYGASLSRLSVASSVLTSQIVAGSEAQSQILDADIASETSQLVRSQILQQAASSLLGQANQQPALALRLLSG